ncbi:hypothetical protein ACFORO_45800 [Amycolatopsis halotolerans]|uniref:Uncharacterized protein n=1 Tax=Amycolatopsis halotolerans TaxID=330083 RepID=A0ABV7QWN6_9PSEU
MARKTVRPDPGSWARQRPLMLDRCQAWNAELEARFPARNVVVELHPESAPAPTTPWNWFLAFDIDGTEFEALVVPDLSAAVFEDSTGVFDDHVKFEDIPAYLARRLNQTRSATG